MITVGKGRAADDTCHLSCGTAETIMTLPADHPRLRKRLPSRGEVLADGVVHGIALLAAAVGIIALLIVAYAKRDSFAVPAVLIYGAGMLLMFGFSMAYNLTPPSPRKWLLRRFDHSAIFLMIAGTYTRRC